MSEEKLDERIRILLEEVAEMLRLERAELRKKHTPIILDAYGRSVADFYHPTVPTTPVIEDEIKDSDSDTAHFDFVTNRTHLSLEFLKELETTGMPMDTLVKGIIDHEIGHYMIYPRECAKLMYIMQSAKALFKDFREDVVAYWVDIVDNTPQILVPNKGRPVRELYKAMNRLEKEGRKLTDKEKARAEAMGYDIEKAIEVQRKYSPDRLLTAYYQIHSHEDIESDMDMEYLKKYQQMLKDKKNREGMFAGGAIEVPTDPEKYLEEKLAELLTLDVTDKANEIANFIQFGHILKDVLQKRKEEMPPKPPLPPGAKGKKGKRGSGGKGKGSSGDSDDEEEGEGDGELGKIIKKLLDPKIGDAPDLDDFTDQQIQEGLDKIIKEYGKGRYEKIRDFVEGETGKTYDRPNQRSASKMPGLASSQLVFHDDQIPFYMRLASTLGLFIHRKPIMTDTTSNYREGQKKFRPSDKLRTLNPFSTGGVILPGITKRYLEKQGNKQDLLYKVPDLIVWIDSSGSMQSPQAGSIAIVAGFMLARNYHANGSSVGVGNYSVDLAFLPPTRDLDMAYSMLAAYWGGGTVPNIQKIREYFMQMSHGMMLPGTVFTTERDYEDLLQRISPEHRREYVDKNLTIAPPTLKQTYEKIDNIVITDGGIANMEEFVAYLNSTAPITRNTIILVNSSAHDEEFFNKQLENTQVIRANKPDDLYGIAIGAAKKIVPAVERPTSLFY